MSYFFTGILQLFLPTALLLALQWTRAPVAKISRLLWITLLAMIIGTWAGASYPKSQQIQLLLVIIHIASLLLFLLSQLSVSLRLKYGWQALLVTVAALRWGNDANLAVFAGHPFISTELLLNSGAIILAVGWALLCGVLLAIMVRQLSLFRWPLLLLLTLCMIVPLSGEMLLLLMKLQIAELTKSSLSYVALAINTREGHNYFCALVLSVLALFFFFPLMRSRRQIAQTTEPVARRKAHAAYLNLRYVFSFTLLALLVVVLVQLYWDRVASLPPGLSEALPARLVADNQIHIPVEQIRDGKLHRFVWIADDGKAVRFFVINRRPERLRLGVVFDACLLCGDQGYVMEGNQVVCVACGVHIFIPSIGKPGGCNPIPLEGWSNDDTELTIPKAALEAGMTYFTARVKLNAQDPVDGQALTNLSAEYQYSYGGRTWFFASEANYQRFVEDPEKFINALFDKKDSDKKDSDENGSAREPR